MACHCHNVLSLLPSLSVQPDLSGLTCKANQTRLTCPSCLILTILLQLSYRLSCRGCPSRLSFPGCHVPDVLCWLSCPSCSLFVVMFWQSSSLSPIQVDHTSLTCLADLSRLTCFSCPVRAVLSELSCPGPRALVLLPSLLSQWSFQLSCTSLPVQNCTPQLSGPRPFLRSRTLTMLSGCSFPGFSLPQLSCPYVFSLLSCSDCPVCLSCPAVPSRMPQS
jgi:hypothetical protein